MKGPRGRTIGAVANLGATFALFVGSIISIATWETSSTYCGSLQLPISKGTSMYSCYGRVEDPKVIIIGAGMAGIKLAHGLA